MTTMFNTLTAFAAAGAAAVAISFSGVPIMANVAPMPLFAASDEPIAEDRGTFGPAPALDVVGVHLTDRVALLNDDRIVPLANLYDGSGEPTVDEDEAQFAIAGPLEPETDKGWIWVSLDLFETKTEQ